MIPYETTIATNPLNGIIIAIAVALVISFLTYNDKKGEILNNSHSKLKTPIACEFIALFALFLNFTKLVVKLCIKESFYLL